VGKNPNAAVCVNPCRRLLSFLTNQPQRAVMVDLEHWSSPSRKLEEGRTPDHSEPLRPRGAGSPRWATPPRPLALGPLCTTRSAPKKPIGESRQSEKVRAGTPRLKKARGEVVPLLASCVPRTPVDGRGADRQQAHQRASDACPRSDRKFPRSRSAPRVSPRYRPAGTRHGTNWLWRSPSGAVFSASSSP
jgi:hypothetical protein